MFSLTSPSKSLVVEILDQDERLEPESVSSESRSRKDFGDEGVEGLSECGGGEQSSEWWGGGSLGSSTRGRTESSPASSSTYHDRKGDRSGRVGVIGVTGGADVTCT